MIFAQLPSPETFTAPGSALSVIAFFLAKHFLYDTKRNKRDDEVEKEKTQLLRDLNHKVATQISISDARREAMEKLSDERHADNCDRLERIETALPHICKAKRNG